MLRNAQSIVAILSLSMAAPALAQQSPYAALAATEARVAAIGFRLTTANAAWCPARQPQFGWIWGDPRLYTPDRRSEALAAYGAKDHNHAYIAALAPTSPAVLAGMTVGTPVVGMGSAPVPDGVGDHPFARVTAIETRVAALPLDAPLALDIGAGRIVRVTPKAGCASDFRVEANERPAAVADGRMVLVNQGLADFAADDDELAAAIAHELAHNILRHRARLDAAGSIAGSANNSARAPACSSRPRLRPTGCRCGCLPVRAMTPLPQRIFGSASVSERDGRCFRRALTRRGATASLRSKPKRQRSLQRARRAAAASAADRRTAALGIGARAPYFGGNPPLPKRIDAHDP
jgi:hypothetical protein